MSIIYIVRHGRAAGSFTDDLDPGLDQLGREQAVAAARLLSSYLPLEIRSSPLKRAQETALPLMEQTRGQVMIEDRFAEIPSPGLGLRDRGRWLRDVMQGRWHEQSEALQRWHADLVDCMRGITRDTVIFSHFVAINAAVGAAEDDDRVLLFRPDNGSVTRIEVASGKLKLIARGQEGDTQVN